jgi:hypothetical protein
MSVRPQEKTDLRGGFSWYFVFGASIEMCQQMPTLVTPDQVTETAHEDLRVFIIISRHACSL